MATPTRTFNTTAGQTIDRALLVLYLNTGTASSPVWSPIGKRVEDSSAEYDWRSENKQDILGQTYGILKKPIITQSFEPCELDAGDAALIKIWEAGVRDQDAAAMASWDVLVGHWYYGADGAGFGERYATSMIEVTGIGGEGGGFIGAPINVTYGGVRAVGSVTRSTDGAVTFTADT